MDQELNLRSVAREIFADALSSVDANQAVRQAVRLEGSRLRIVNQEFDLRAGSATYAVAVGKAAGAMAQALDSVLGDKLAGGVISTTPTDFSITNRWRVFAGGHPVPNEASLAAARASFDLLQHADESALIIFLISGGGSAMFESPRDAEITLAELREANRVLTSCGATIAEINAVRRCFSAVKGGKLSEYARSARQVTLIISDTNPGDEANVASGLTLAPPLDAPDASSIIKHYNLAARLPQSILRLINQPDEPPPAQPFGSRRRHNHYVLLDNETAIERAAAAAHARGFKVELAGDIVEQPIAEGCRMLVSRLLDLHARAESGQVTCLISGGEFGCPVHGPGVGGRNAETVLRCAFEMDAPAHQSADDALQLVALSAGTDGVDGNSPAAGALADTTTLQRAYARDLNAQSLLDASDAYTFFAALGDAVVTGPTGTNVRDLRIMLAAKSSRLKVQSL